jgi:hypothetical protein
MNSLTAVCVTMLLAAVTLQIKVIPAAGRMWPLYQHLLGNWLFSCLLAQSLPSLQSVSHVRLQQTQRAVAALTGQL